MKYFYLKIQQMDFFIEEDVTEDSTIYEAFYNKYYPGWSEVFQQYKGEMKNVSDIISKAQQRTGRIYPMKKDIFRALEMTPLDKVKVVIWGQDPYPTLLSNGKPRAQGYSFGVDKSDEVPKSLINIYKELKNEYPEFNIPRHGDLSGWAKQGVLFMNTSLCYSPSDPKAYLNLWFRFTNIIIEILNEKVPNCIHVMWGNRCEKLIDNISSREIYTAPHPSPLSAYRGFFGCNHFIKINITLMRQGKEEIDWNQI